MQIYIISNHVCITVLCVCTVRVPHGTGQLAVPLRFLLFKDLGGTATVIDRRIAYHQAHGCWLDETNSYHPQKYFIIQPKSFI